MLLVCSALTGHDASWVTGMPLMMMSLRLWRAIHAARAARDPWATRATDAARVAWAAWATRVTGGPQMLLGPLV